MAEPLIAVKKADGTVEMVPFSQVRARQKSTPVATSPVVSVTPVKPEPKPEVKSEVKPEITTELKESVPQSIPKPSFQIPIPMESGDPLAEVKKLLSVAELPAAPPEPLLAEKFPPLNSNQEAHLLHEELEPHEVSHPDLVAHSSYEDSALAAAKAAQIAIPTDLTARFTSLATSLYKGVRTLEQVLEYANLEVLKGGLGLSRAETERLATALQSVPGTPKLSPKSQQPAKTNPAQARVDLVPPPPNQPQGFGGRQPMRDVEPPRPKPLAVMGPVEEMKNFTLTDWRRLAVTPEKAKVIMLNKFAGLKNESYFMYQDACAAWLTSPLLIDYQNMIVNALNSGERLSELQSVSTQQHLTAADIAAIVEINRSLKV